MCGGSIASWQPPHFFPSALSFEIRGHHMTTLRVPDDLKFTSPTTYQIFIKGFLDESWSDRLNGMTIDHLNTDSGALPVTKLCGKVQDQAELLGVLNSIYEMHLPLISLGLVLENNDEADH
jgi:hypothetical protein